MTTVSFTTQDLAGFSEASRDRNPLHLSDEYARTTPYAEPVVFGILGTLAALGQLPGCKDRLLQNISVEFRNPLAVGIPYRLDVIESSTDCTSVKLYDTTRLMMKTTFTFASGHASTRPLHIAEAACPREEAADQKKEDLLPGIRVTGTYAPQAEYFAQVMTRWGLAGKGATANQIAAMMWASFVVGMELPGKRAIFWRLMLDFHPEQAQTKEPFFYDMAIQDFDERVDLLHIAGTFSSGTAPCATAQMWAFVRQDSPRPSFRRITDLLPKSDLLRERVALVIGGSRGLGAAITQALASQGCSVVMTYHHCSTEAEQVRASVDDRSGLIELVQGNAADVEWCQAVRSTILKRYGRLDLLVCNASPPIRPLRLEPEKLAQFQDFLAQSVALVTVPMSTFLDILADQAGWNIVISSAFVKDLPADFPHYVTTKCAIEGLVHWAAAHHPKVRSLLVRPPKLLTDQTNTAGGRQGAMRVEQAAVSIVKHLCHPNSSEAIHILDRF